MVSDVLYYRYLLEGAPIVYVPIPTRCSSSRSGGGGFSPSDDGSSGTFYVHLRTASCIATCEEARGEGEGELCVTLVLVLEKYKRRGGGGPGLRTRAKVG